MSKSRENQIYSALGCPKCDAPMGRACKLIGSRPYVHPERRHAYYQLRLSTEPVAPDAAQDPAPDEYPALLVCGSSCKDIEGRLMVMIGPAHYPVRVAREIARQLTMLLKRREHEEVARGK